MDQLLQCPVCTLYLHNGMTLESHLDTHPKDQVIKALCSLSSNRSNYGSRASTPMHSERSYRSRSRTPATDDGSVRWNTPQLSADHERFWRRTPSRTTKTSTVTRSNTPDTRIGDAHFDNSGINDSASVYSTATYQSRNDKILAHHVATPAPVPEYEQPYPYFQEQKEEKEVKYSRSAEYMNNSHNVYAYNSSSCMKLQNALLPTPTKKNSEVVNVMATNKKQGDFIKIVPKSSNIALLKANMGPVQYLAPGVMVSTGPTYVQKNSKNLIMTSNIQAPTTMVQTKAISNPSVSHDYSHMSAGSGTFSPNTTVVTQNSQIIYSEMVHNVVDGKRFIPGMQAMLSGPDNVANIAQTNSVYQNVMVVDQFGNTSCMYTTPQQLLPKPSTSVYTHKLPSLDKNIADPNKTLIIEVSPIVKPSPIDVCDASTSTSVPSTPVSCTPEPTRKERPLPVRVDHVEISPGSTKGLKILSNIKVEVPVQHHKNLLNTVVDLTEPNECDYSHAPKTPERILPDLDSENNTADCMLPDTSNDDPNIVSNTFSVIKNVGNPPLYKEPKHIDSRIHETESSDSCPVPDLICNEKPSISPCSELSDNGDNATHHTTISPKPETSQQQNNREISIEIKKEATPRTYKNNPLRLNNIFVKKHKKVLQIKNAKFPTPSTSTTHDAMSPDPTHSSRSPSHFTVTKMQYIHPEKNFQNDLKPGTLETISIDKIHNTHEPNNFDADTEEQSMDMELEPVAGSSYNETNQYSGIDLTQVKEEVNSSNEFSNHTGVSERDFTELASLRPINVQYNMANDFSEDSNHRELLELEAASKSKQFASMMNDNYFGDNIYADYFTPDRGESFNTVRESGFGKDGPHLWGEPSQKEVSEFVLPNFIHESYKIAESGHGHFLAGEEAGGDACSREGTVLDICADERMPPRGELSGQGSNGDMDAPWTGMYTEVTPAEPYDLIARESWVSDASDADSNDKQDHLVMDLPKPRLVSCPACGLQLCSAKELRRHCAEAHAPPAAAAARILDGAVLSGVKKEEKPDDNVLAGILQDTKAGITTTVLEVFDPLDEAKSKIIIKQEPKRRKRDNVCATCKVDFLSDVAFHQHLKIHPLECLTCGKCFFRRANLALHIKTHLGIKNYKCEVCEKRFITRQKLVEHHNAHTGRAPVKCPLCPQTFRRYSNMVQHRDRHHFHKKAKVRDYMCQCGEVFHSRAKLRWHRETHDGKPKACQYCSDKFVHRSSLTRHVRRAHNPLYMREDLGKKNENVPCPICKQVYLRTNLKSHLRTHSGKRPYTCIICNKGFSTPWNLKLHRWTHMSRSAKPYKCTLCKGAFIRQAEYIAHINAHKSVRPYTCNYCGCQFIRKYNCQRHVREHEVAKKYVCKVPDCGKSFHRSYYLSEHMKVHSGARPFSCNICGKSSSNKSNHNKHVKIHHAREPVATEA